MLDHAHDNTRKATAARFRALWDAGLNWGIGPNQINPLPMRSAGFLILRRWSDCKYPMPDAPAAVGYAARPASTVSNNTGATYADGVWWHFVDKVSQGGLLAERRTRLAHVSVWDSGSNVGALPNTPTGLRTIQTQSDTILVSWIYNPLDEQAAPARFDVFSDSGTGTMDFVTPVANVTYLAGRSWYTYESGALNDGDAYAYTVRARSSGGVYSLFPQVGSPPQGSAPSWLLVDIKKCGNVVIETTAPAKPAAPFFG